MKKLALTLFVLFASISKAEAGAPCIGWVLSGDFSGCGTVASPIELSTNVTMPGVASVAGTAGTASLTVNASQKVAVYGARTLSNSTEDDTAAIYGYASGSMAPASGLFAYGVRGEAQVSKASGAGSVTNWGVFGRAGTVGVGTTTVTNMTGVRGFGYGGLTSSAGGNFTSGTAQGSSYGVFGQADTTGTGVSFGAVGYSATGDKRVGAYGIAPGGGATSNVGVWARLGTYTEVTPSGSYALYTDGVSQFTDDATFESATCVINSAGITCGGTLITPGADITSVTANSPLNGGGASGAVSIGLSDGDRGDITTSSSGTVWTIDNDVVTYAKMQNVSATSRVLGRITAGAGDTEELTGTQLTTLCDTFSTSATTKGCVPGSNGAGATAFLNGNGGWTTPAGGIGGSATAPGVLYASGANTAATEATVFAWYATEDTLNLGSTAVTNCGAGSCDNTLNVTNNVGTDVPIRSWGMSASGYSGIGWNNSSSAAQGSIGFGNASVGITAYRGLNFISSDSADYIFGESTGGSVIARVFMTSGSAGIQWANGSSGAVGAASTGKLRYNSTTQTFQSSQNGAAFANVVTGTVTANTLAKSASSTTGAVTDSLLTDNGTTLAYNTNKLTVASSTGNTTVGGTLDVASTFTVATSILADMKGDTRVVHLSGKASGAPTIGSGCGTGATIDSISSDMAGEFTTGTSATNCLLNFNSTWTTNRPVCLSIQSNDALYHAATTTTTTMTWSGITSSTTWKYICMGTSRS